MIRKIAWVLSIISLIAMIFVIVTVLPDTVAIHFNVHGEADNWGSKWIYAIFSLIPVVLLGFYEFYRRRRQDHPNYKMEEKLVPVIALVFIPIFWLVLPLSSNPGKDVRLFCGVVGILGLLMMFLGNYMGKIRQNPYLGLKLPWTLKNETVWNKTHRLNGFTGILGGGLMVIGAIIGACNPEHAFAWCFGTLIPGILLIVLVPSVYSYLLYRKLEKEGKL